MANFSFSLTADRRPLTAPLRIGSRKSPLAVAQAEQVAAMLCRTHPALAAKGMIALHGFTTTGDRLADRPLTEAGGKGLFTKELEEALLDGRIDLAVHSAKDMPTLLPPGLIIGAVPEREDARDALISGHARSLTDLPERATLGTSSLRRAAQALHVRPDLRVVPLRGNVHTRLDKLARGAADATLLAVAGLNRLGVTVPHATPLEITEMLPAVGQGALALEYRESDARTQALLAPLHHDATGASLIAERAMLRVLDGSCRTPIAGYALMESGLLRLRGLLLTPDGRHCWRVDRTAPASDAQALGEEAGRELLRMSGGGR